MEKPKPFLLLFAALIGCFQGGSLARSAVAPDAAIVPLECGTETAPAVLPIDPQAPPSPFPDAGASAPVYPYLGIVCDRQCLELAGSKEKFEADLKTIMAIVQKYYAELDVHFQLNPVQYVEGSQNPWQDAPNAYWTNADNFRRWASSQYRSYHNAALLFTGQDFDGIDYAWVGHVCEGDNYRYGQIDYAYRQPITQRANLTTHELGHILGADHTSTSRTLIMSPSIYDGTLSWDPTSLNSIRNGLARSAACFRPGVTSLADVPATFGSREWESIGNLRYQLPGRHSFRTRTLNVWNLSGRMYTQTP